MATDEPAGPPPATAKSKSYRVLALVRTSLKYHFETRETGNFFKPAVDEKLLKHFPCYFQKPLKAKK
jgi:hypothetical protein